MQSDWLLAFKTGRLAKSRPFNVVASPLFHVPPFSRSTTCHRARAATSQAEQGEQGLVGGSQGDSVMDVGLYIRSATLMVLSAEQLRVRNGTSVQ